MNSLEVTPQLTEDLVLKIKSIVGENIVGVGHLKTGWKVEAQLAAQEILNDWLRQEFATLGECRKNLPEHSPLHKETNTCTKWQRFWRIV